MTTDVFLSLFDYGAWAGGRLLDRAAGLPEEELHRRFSRGADSIHQTLVHLVSTDWRWFARWQQGPLPAVLTAAELPTLDAIRARSAALAEPRRAYLSALTAAELAAPIHWTALDGTTRNSLPRWQGILQCANHGTQHRAEIAAMLTEAGRSPGDLDYSLFALARR